MRSLAKAALVAVVMGGTVADFAIPAMAQTAAPYYDNGYYGPDPYGPPPPPDYGPPPPPDYGPPPPPDYGPPPPPAYGYAPAYGDPYACETYDYYDPPWGYPPDYCDYNVWYQPVYVGGLWYSGPIYYRDFGGDRMFWLNGGWHRDEWRGERPAHIDWSRNMRWAGGPERGRSFGGGDAFRGNRGNYGAIPRGGYGGIARGNYGASAPRFAPQGGGSRGGFGGGGGGAPHAFAQSQPNRSFGGFGGGGRGFRGGQGGGGFRGGQGGGGFRGGQGGGGGGHASGGGGHHHG